MKKNAPAKIIFYSSFLTVLLLVFVLDGCVHNSSVEDFYFIEYSGLKRELFAEPRDTSDSGNDLISLDGKLSTPFYHLEQGLQINDRGRSFFVLYTADCPLTLRLKINDEYLLADLPNIRGRQVEFRYPLGRNALFQGFQLESDSPEGSLKIIGSGVEDSYAGADFSGNPALVGHGVKILSNEEAVQTEVQMYSAIPGYSEPDILQLGLRTETPDPIVLYLKDGDNEPRKIELRRPERYGQLSLYVSSLGFFPESITIEGSATSIETFGFYHTPSGGEPISMDFASILRYPIDKWRKSEYELFRWSVDPKVLVFDFIDYSTQAAFFKRLAFFVEKDGYQGRLLSNQELQKLHGWNAHDYRMEDIARFYNQVEESDLILNPEELEFKEILISEGVLSRDENGSYHFINGAVISVSRESMDYLRRLFLTHEGFHGIFFTDPGFQGTYDPAVGEFFSPGERFLADVFALEGV